jgi:hypothetical protein
MVWCAAVVMTEIRALDAAFQATDLISHRHGIRWLCHVLTHVEFVACAVKPVLHLLVNELLKLFRVYLAHE